MMSKTPKYFYVYIITNRVSGKQYVGSRVCYKDSISDDLYWGSSKYLKHDFEIFDKANFTKEILQSDYTNTTDLLDAETMYILKYNTLAPNGYNRFLPNTRSGFHMFGAISPMKDKYHTPETKRLMSISHKDVKFSVDHKDNLAKSVKNVKDNESIEKKQKRHEYAKGEKNGMFGVKGENHPMFGRHQSVEAIQAIKDKNRLNFSGEKNPMFGIVPEKILCTHCNKLIDKRNYARWHGDNCKIILT